MDMSGIPGVKRPERPMQHRGSTLGVAFQSRASVPHGFVACMTRTLATTPRPGNVADLGRAAKAVEATFGGDSFQGYDGHLSR
jgi:hypothetical protein